MIVIQVIVDTNILVYSRARDAGRHITARSKVSQPWERDIHPRSAFKFYKNYMFFERMSILLKQGRLS